MALSIFGVKIMQRKPIFLLSLVLSLLLGGCWEAEDQLPEISVPQQLLQQPQQRLAGEQLFLKHCRECHGTTAEGRNPRAVRFVPPAPDFISHHYMDAEPAYLFWRIAEGKRTEPFRSRGSVMPAWEPHLTEQQIWQLVAYLRQRAGSD